MTDIDRIRLMEACIGMQDLPRLVSLCNLCIQAQSVEGETIEIGCYKGRTAALLASLINHKIILYDSFQGLSEPGPQDTNKPPFVQGSNQADADEVLDYFRTHHLPEPVIVKKWLGELDANELPTQIRFCHIDVDLYEPTLRAMRLVWPRMSKGGVVIVDDYRHLELPGVEAAVSEFVNGRQIKFDEGMSCPLQCHFIK